MKRIDYFFTLIATLILLASCGSSSDEPSPSTKPKVVLRMLVQAPKAPSSRIADPHLTDERLVGHLPARLCLQ